MRLYPARGVQYESHLAPPPHLVGLRVAALDALLATADGVEQPNGAAVVVASVTALAEMVPDPALRPHGFTIEKGGLIDLDETTQQLVACGYERVDQVEDRGQFALRGDILDVYPATEERAVRCELFDIEVERLTYFSTFTQRSLDEADSIEIAPAAEIGLEHRELAEMAAQDSEEERPDVADLLPVDQFRSVLSLLPDDALVAIAAEEELAPSLKDLWDDVTHELPGRGRPPPLRRPRRAHEAARRAHAAEAVEHLRRPAAQLPRPGRRHQRALAQGRRARAREARPLRLPDDRRLVAQGRGRARRLQPDAGARELPRRRARRRTSRA